jgi:uncharacterized protein
MMEEQLRIRSGWAQLGIFLGLMGGALIIMSFVALGMMTGAGVQPIDPDLSNPKVLTTMKWLQAVSSIVIFLVPALVFGAITFQKNLLYHLGLRPAYRPFFFLLAVVCIMMAFPFVFWLGELNQGLPLPEWMTRMEKDANKQLEAFLKAETKMDILLNVLMIAFLPAICEELCFRGALQGIFLQITKRPWLAILVTATLFSALHLQFQGFFPRMFLGVVLGVLYYYSGSLWPSIVAHFVNNAVQVIAISNAPEYIQKNPSMPAWGGLLSGAAVAAVLYVYISKGKEAAVETR